MDEDSVGHDSCANHAHCDYDSICGSEIGDNGSSEHGNQVGAGDENLKNVSNPNRRDESHEEVLQRANLSSRQSHH